MSDLIHNIISPYKVYKQRKAREKELQSKDKFDTTLLKREQLEMMVERDFDEIASEYLDTGQYKDVTIKIDSKYLDVLESVVSRQGFECIKTSEDTIVVRC